MYNKDRKRKTASERSVQHGLTDRRHRGVVLYMSVYVFVSDAGRRPAGEEMSAFRRSLFMQRKGCIMARRVGQPRRRWHALQAACGSPDRYRAEDT